MQKLLRGFDLLRRGYAHAVQRVRDAEVLPLEQSQRVVCLLYTSDAADEL